MNMYIMNESTVPCPFRFDMPDWIFYNIVVLANNFTMALNNITSLFKLSEMTILISDLIYILYSDEGFENPNCIDLLNKVQQYSF